MITGIDETGDFDPKSNEFNYFTAVHIDQNGNKFNIKKSQFNIWESSIPNKFKDKKGEIKGQLLPDEYLDTFSDTILESNPRVLYSVIRIKPSENPIEILEKHKQYEIEQIENVIKQATEYGHDKWVEGYKKILYWYKNKNYQIIMKIKCLEHLLGISLNRVLGWAQLTYILDNKDISNISDIRFKIDKDFVKAENVKILWGELQRQFWQQFTHNDPIPVMAAWKKEDHPIYKVFEDLGGRISIKNVFRNNTEFLDSKENWEIRMADITGTILHRYQNKGRCIRIGKELFKHLGVKQNNYKHLILNDVN